MTLMAASLEKPAPSKKIPLNIKLIALILIPLVVGLAIGYGVAIATMGGATVALKKRLFIT